MKIRPAIVSDVAIILEFIKKLAVYENLLNAVVATEEIIKEWIFEKNTAKVILAEIGNEPIGFALYFNNFSTFLGKAGMYLEDLYIEPQHRGQGYGKQILQYLAKIAFEQGLGRFEWWCLNDNKSSVNFYLKIGAKPMKEWTVYRLNEDQIADFKNC